MSPFTSITRRFSRSSSGRRSQRSQHQYSDSDPQNPQSPTTYAHPPDNQVATNIGPGGVTALPTTATGIGTNTSLREQALGNDGYMVLPKQGVANEGRPISSATDQSFDFANRPVTSNTVATSAGGAGGGGVTMSPRVQQQSNVGGINLSRTDQIVLKHFWESKHDENSKRDLHYLKFPFFPQYPGHRDLMPYCEIYHLVKTSPGATIISLGSANGVYIGFELATGSQLHIDLDDDWFSGPQSTSITHHRVTFRPYQSMLSDPSSATLFKAWPKPLTIEFLEDQYLAWTHDLMSICWEGREIRELGSGNPAATTGGTRGDGDGSLRSASGQHAGSIVDDGYASERSGQEI